jgi:hypothetical protein
MYGFQEVVFQDGDPIPPPVIQIVNGRPIFGKPVRFLVTWAGNWNNVDFRCDDYSPPVYYHPKGVVFTCEYRWLGVYWVYAALYYQDTWKASTMTQVMVRHPQVVFAPTVSRAGGFSWP